MKKGIIKLLTVGLLILVVCMTIVGAPRRTTVTILAGISTTDDGLQEIITEAVAKKYPEISLQWEVHEWSDNFHPRMQQYIQTGLPDIIIGKAQDVATYGGQGLLASLNGKSYLNNILDAAIPA